MGFIRNFKRGVGKRIDKYISKYEKDTINIEVSGCCNAKCSYCPTGSGKHITNTKFMSPDLFEKIIQHLIKIKIISKKVTSINLYHWGEPLLNQHLNEILSILGKYNLKATISSNFIKAPNISEENFKNIHQTIFSLCSLDKENYKRIYKADIDKTLENHNKFLEQVKEFNPSIVTSVHWIRYKFNHYEFDAAKKYFDEKDVCCITDNHYASFADMDARLNLEEGKLDPEDEKYYDYEQLYKDIWFEREQIIMKKYAPEKFDSSKCVQMRTLTIGEDGQFIGCCGVYSKHKEYNLGSILELNGKEIYKIQHAMPICNRCCNTMLAWYSHAFGNYHDCDFADEMKLLEEQLNLTKENNGCRN